ncbi:unnamed protein product [Pleuronectes platessa]|uniref:Uncharacterized protein n=1 Tax=Pleuronectes platessa TaxID=8262 RepID=A0A9N7Y6S1_PLEPL|nr:unnamed protein product [Pleuronectes platessa]
MEPREKVDKQLVFRLIHQEAVDSSGFLLLFAADDGRLPLRRQMETETIINNYIPHHSILLNGAIKAGSVVLSSFRLSRGESAARRPGELQVQIPKD